MHVSKPKRKFLDDRSEECILVGYGPGSTYRLMTKKTTRIVVDRDVKFHEASLGLRDVKSDFTPLYLEYDDQEDIPTPEELSGRRNKSLESPVAVQRSAHLEGMREENEEKMKALIDRSDIET
jgi:hypothetical protein